MKAPHRKGEIHRGLLRQLAGLAAGRDPARPVPGGTEDDHVVGDRVHSDHDGGERPLDLNVTLYADAQPAPWGVEEIPFGCPDAHLTNSAIERIMRIALTAHQRWQAGDRVLVRC